MLENGANRKVTDRWGRTPEDLARAAAEREHTEAPQMFARTPLRRRIRPCKFI